VAAECWFACALVVPNRSNRGDYVSVGRSPFVLRLAGSGDLHRVHRLVREASGWLRTRDDTDQWEKPWPNPVGQLKRMRNDLIGDKIWLAWDGVTAAATITIDTGEPVDAEDRPVWPPHKRREPAVYVRRVIVSRRYAGLGLGAALLDWATATAARDYGASVVRIDVWTTNLNLHSYYERQSFVRRQARELWELPGYPSQALFEREAGQASLDYKKLLIEVPATRKP
jgi:GNAT superfamily N-acetyltransferase